MWWYLSHQSISLWLPIIVNHGLLCNQGCDQGYKQHNYWGNAHAYNACNKPARQNYELKRGKNITIYEATIFFSFSFKFYRTKILKNMHSTCVLSRHSSFFLLAWGTAMKAKTKMALQSWKVTFLFLEPYF